MANRPRPNAVGQPAASRRVVLAETQDRTGGLQIFGLTLSQLSYRGLKAFVHEKCLVVKSQHMSQRCSVTDFRTGVTTSLIHRVVQLA